MILFIFAFLSGILTITAPCIWPLLPIVLSSTALGGKRKALGVTLGVVFSFGAFTLLISYLEKIFPIDPNIFRYLAAAIITFLGLSLIIPSLTKLTEGFVSRLNSRFFSNLKLTGGGFGSGLVMGGSLGIVWTPCAGPILATIATLASTKQVSGGIVLITLFYCLGIGIPLFIFSILGSRIFSKSKRLAPFTGRIQQIFGVIMIATALLVLTNSDKALEANLLNRFPAFSDFSTSLESTDLVKQGLDSLKGQQSSLGTLGQAPDFVGITKWLNTDKPLTLADLKGKVVLVDFWTYTCINCLRTLPFVTSWYNKYGPQGFVVIGVHTPEFEFEKDTSNVENAIKQYGIKYPVAQDNNYATWNNYKNEYWPAEYLIDANGVLRRTHFGEGEYDQTEEAIKELLKQKGASVDTTLVNMKDQTPQGELSPETYLGASRMQFFYPQGNIGTGAKQLDLTKGIPVNSFSLGGSWTINDEEAISETEATLEYHFFASKVYLVLSPSVGGSNIKVFLDGRQLDQNSAGIDVKDGEVRVDSQRLYNLIDLKGGPSEHTLHLEFETPGTGAFAFTFG